MQTVRNLRERRLRHPGDAAAHLTPSTWMVRRWLLDGALLQRGIMTQIDKSEKITINIGLIDLGQIDLLVNEGFYANRTDFIRTAIRRQLETRSGAVDQTVARRTITLGTQHYSRRDLEELRTTGRSVEVRVLGLATIDEDVTPELALETITSVEVLGAFRASNAVKAALAPRTV
jgi:Arc/MetJ-type ribon-helix-helix transcriptional regulator